MSSCLVNLWPVAEEVLNGVTTHGSKVAPSARALAEYFVCLVLSRPVMAPYGSDLTGPAAMGSGVGNHEVDMELAFYVCAVLSEAYEAVFFFSPFRFGRRTCAGWQRSRSRARVCIGQQFFFLVRTYLLLSQGSTFASFGSFFSFSFQLSVPSNLLTFILITRVELFSG